MDAFGNDGEMRLKLDARDYWPRYSWDCANTEGYEYADGRWWCEMINHRHYNVNEGWITLRKGSVLRVGAIDNDEFLNYNDEFSADLLSAQWYVDTCETYEVVVADPIESGISTSTCLSVDAGADVSGVDIGVGAEHCVDWSPPPEAVIWYIEVKPAN